MRIADAEQVIEILTRELKAGIYIEPLGQIAPTTFKTDLKQDMACSATIDYYLETINSSLSKASRRTYKTCANSFRNYLADKELLKMKLKLFGIPQVYSYTDYLSREQSLGNRNFNKQRGWLVTFFEFYRKRKVIASNPVTDAEIGKKEVSGQHIPFKQEQIEAIVDYFQANWDDQLWLFLNCVYYLSARPHEE